VPRRGRQKGGPPSPREDGPQRIAKLLARAGVASRRDIERMIADGRIAIGGEVLTTPATLLTDLAGVTVDGRPVRPAQASRLYRFYKPQGTITAARDPKGRATIYDRLPKGLPRLMPVGRLDFMTEGLLLLTNDGELKRRLELPSSSVERRYRARAFGRVSQDELDRLAEGITIEAIHYGPIIANLERRTGGNCWIELGLTEGKNREVRRVLAHLGLQVSRLIRTAYGPFDLAGLDPGLVEEVPRAELDAFRASLK
jgi:23S rRNA pseudouridine2605 synthase